MQSLFIVAAAIIVAHHFCFCQCGEEFAIEKLNTQAAVLSSRYRRFATAAGLNVEGLKALWWAIHSRSTFAMNSGPLSLRMICGTVPRCATAASRLLTSSLASIYCSTSNSTFSRVNADGQPFEPPSVRCLIKHEVVAPHFIHARGAALLRAVASMVQPETLMLRHSQPFPPQKARYSLSVDLHTLPTQWRCCYAVAA